MNDLCIIADSTCDLSPQLILENDITIVPLYVVLGDQSLKDGEQVAPNDIYAYVTRTGQTPKTAAASLYDFMQAFQEPAAEHKQILFIGISSQMSATIANAMAAANEYPQATIEVVDAGNLSTGIGLLVMRACDMARQGADVHQIAAALRAAVPQVRASFIIDTLDYLYRGGRCTRLQALGANMLNLKPKIVVQDGAMRPDRKYRGRIERCAAIYAQDVIDDMINPDRTRCFVTHSQCEPGIVESVMDVVQASGRFDQIIQTNAGCVITSHCGPNTIGVLYIEQ